MIDRISRRMRRKMRLVLIALVLGATIVTPASELFALDRAEETASLRSLKDNNPGLKIYETEARVTRLYGTAFGSGTSAVDAAENFRWQHSKALGVKPTDLVPESRLEDGRHTQPLMYNEETGDYEFTLAYYTQHVDGVPVFGSELKLLVRNEPGFPIVLAASTLRNVGEFSASNARAVNTARAIQAAQSKYPGLVDFTEPRTVVWAGYEETSSNPTIAVVFEGANDLPERKLFVVDAATGGILHEEDKIIFEDVIGSVSGLSTENYAADYCEEEIPFALRYARVSISGQSAYSDTFGNFTIPNAGSDPVVVMSQLWGQYFMVYNEAGSEEILIDTVLPPGPVDFMHNSFNINEFVRAQVNGYVQSNYARETVLHFNPSYPTISMQTSFPVYVNRDDGYCPGNAWYDGYSINFCRTGGLYPNTAWQSVIHHEYGHHVVEVGGSGQGAYGEGFADVVALLWADISELGLGFYGTSCSTPLRDADNTMQYPCSGESHYCGQLLSGCVWSTRNELILTDPENYREILGSLAINSVLLHAGTSITPEITIDWLTLDDDDDNLNNGTPHWDEICAGFGAHGMDCPDPVMVIFDYPDGRPEIVDPSEQASFRVLVSPAMTDPIPGTGQVFCCTDGQSFFEGTVTQIQGNEYEVVLPVIDCGDRVDWYVTVEASGMGQICDPEDAPAVAYSTVPATEQLAAMDDDFETDQGWTVQNDASDGFWQRGIPAGGGTRGDPPTDYDGSGRCYLTDNVSGNSDVDEGSTTLISPSINLDGFDAVISYARWFSNDQGDGPLQDIFRIDISSDGGSSWTLVEQVGPVEQAMGGWFTNQLMVSDYVTPTADIRMRFIASDTDPQSIVEAAVDAFSVVRLECESFLCGDADASGSVDIDDAVYLINHIFSGGPPPDPPAAGDADCSGAVDIDDAVCLINYIFSSANAPCDIDGDGVPDC